uniref:Cytochrome c oxidase assembly protein COX20, mitochondrial n=1 Tax=Syphacia muris TaxID=451379 RepID=A0A0N5A9S3_9BILA
MGIGRDGYGLYVFITTSLVTAAVIGYVFWDEKRLKEKRRKNVREYVRARQQLENMERYQAQQKFIANYGKSDSAK